MTNKILFNCTVVGGEQPTTTSAADFGELAVNLPDRKIYVRDPTGAAVAVSQKVEDWLFKAYAEGDLVINGTQLLQCSADIPAKAFDAGDWTVISPPGDAGSAAILKEPTVADHNTIDLTGDPTFHGLVIVPDAAHSVDLLQVGPDSPLGAPRSRIDRLGIPSATLSGNVRLITQTGIGSDITLRGMPVARNGTSYVKADANLVSSQPIVGVCEEVIDSNNIVIRTGGLIDQLQSAAFGGSIAANTVYYLQDTAGGLGVTPAATGEKVPVILTISGTMGLVITSPVPYVSRAGDEMTDGLSFGSNTVSDPLDLTRHLSLYGTTYGVSVTSGRLNLVAGGGAGRVVSKGPFEVENANDSVDPTVKFRRDADDDQYIGLAGDASANWIIAESAAPGGKNLRFDNRTGGANRKFEFLQDSVAFAQIDDPSYVSATAGATSLMKRSQADARYPQQGITISAGTGLTGGGSLAANRTLSFDTSYGDGRYARLAASANTFAGDVGVNGYIRVAGYVYSSASSVSVGLQMGHNGTNAILNNKSAGDLIVQFGGTNEFTFQSNGAASSSNDVVNIGAGDGRYAKLGNGINPSADWSTPTRSFGTVYTNTGDGFRMVSVSVGTSNAAADVRLEVHNGSSYVEVARVDTDNKRGNLITLVPPGRSYRCRLVDGSATISEWSELS